MLKNFLLYAEVLYFYEDNLPWPILVSDVDRQTCGYKRQYLDSARLSHSALHLLTRKIIQYFQQYGAASGMANALNKGQN